MKLTLGFSAHVPKKGIMGGRSETAEDIGLPFGPEELKCLGHLQLEVTSSNMDLELRRREVLQIEIWESLHVSFSFTIWR